MFGGKDEVSNLQVLCYVCHKNKTSLERRVMKVKLTKRIHGFLKQAAHTRGMSESDFIRELVHRELARLSFLSDDEKKALGVIAR